MGKIIQIAACGHVNTSTTQSNLTLFALCDDGRLWALNCANGSWSDVPLPIPNKPRGDMESREINGVLVRGDTESLNEIERANAELDDLLEAG